MMRFHFLGGASDVGASCTLLEVAGKRILVDAGIRMQKREGSSLPDFERLQQVGAPDAILITHAHTDHIGALPLLYLGFPQVPILCTEPTRALTRVLLSDSLKIMESRWEQEEEIPLYPPHAVQGMLGRMQAVEVGQAVPVCEGITGTWVPAGHILGACSITLETPEGRILFAGDYSVDRQQTVEGITIPPERPHLMVTESTYGNRIHCNRRLEEQRLVEAVAEVVAAGGKVLIPSFALGRAQEVLLLLLDAQRRGHLPPFPVYADGMVKTICQVYTSFPEHLTPQLRRSIQSSGTPFFYPGGALAVMANQRERIANGKPCAMVASSGMLTGGPSRYYAEQWMDKPNNAIFITGYQDEESPGHHLIQLAQDVEKKGEGLLRLDGVARRVLCQVRRYGLSAHADAAQVLGVTCRLKPDHVVLVHGDEDARQALSHTFPDTMKVHRPANGQTLEFGRFRTAPKLSQAAYAGLSRPLDLDRLKLRLLEKNGAGRRYTVQELARVWYGNPTPQESQALAGALAQTGSGFAPDPHRPFLFAPVAPAAPSRPAPLPAKPKKANDESGVLKAVQRVFGAFPDFERAGVRQEEKTVVLHFDFPTKAYSEYQETLQALAAETGWAVEVSPKESIQAVQRAAREALPLTLDISKVSLFAQEPRVRVRAHIPPGTSEELLQAARERFFQVTGKSLELEPIPEPPPPQVPVDELGRLEPNLAYRKIRNALAERGVPVISVGKKGEPAYLELGFYSPATVAAHQDLLEQLSRELGWELRPRLHPIKEAIVTRARQLMPLAWAHRKEPSLNEKEGFLRCPVTGQPEEATVRALSAQLERETGFRLVVAPG